MEIRHMAVMTFNFDLVFVLQKLTVKFGTDTELSQIFWKLDLYFSFREVTASVTNQPTNKQTGMITLPPGCGKNISLWTGWMKLL